MRACASTASAGCKPHLSPGSLAVIDLAARFDKLAAGYDVGILPVELMLRRRRARLLGHACGEVLDIGIGTGRTLRFYPRGSRITGVDVSGEMLERARSRAGRLGYDVDFQLMSADNLAFAGGSFDVVVSSLVLCSVESVERALQEVRRVLRPGGELLMMEHIRPRGWLGLLFDWLDPWFQRQSCHLNRRTAERVRAAGFDVVQEERWLWGIFACIRAIKPAA